MLRAQDSKSDQAILRSVRYAHSSSALWMVDPPWVIETSLGACRLQGASRADIVKIPLLDWYRYFSPTPEASRATQKALRNGDALAIDLTMEAPIFRTGGRVPVRTTFTPLWLSDGTFVIRGDSSIVPIDEYHGQSVTAITQDDMTFEL